MRSGILAFVAGVVFLQTVAALPSPFALLAGGCVSLAAMYWSRYAVPPMRTAIRCAGFFLLGVVWASLCASRYLAHELPKEWEGRDITLIGTIDSLPGLAEQGVRFNFQVEQVMPLDGAMPVVPSRLALAWYSGFGHDETQAVPDLRPGERWQLTVRLRRPHGTSNPYVFDYEAWLLEQNLRATGTVRVARNSGAENRRLDPFVFSVNNAIERTRGWLRERILAALPGHDYAGVIVALVIGDQRAIDQSDWKVFNRTGIGHLISISGLHITMVAGMFAGLINVLWRRSFFTQAQLPLILPAQKAAALAGALAALVYVALAGFGVPAQRTLYMLSVVAVAMWTGRIINVSYVLCAALGVVVLLDSWAVLWPGFWLSFGAVATIVYASAGRVAAQRRQRAANTNRVVAGLKEACHTQYVVTIGLVPLTMLLFGQISLVSPIANAVAIPLVSFFVTPLALAGSVVPAPLGAWVLEAAHFLIMQLASFLGWMSGLPAAVWASPVPSLWMFVAASLGTLWLLAPPGWPVRWLGFAGMLPLVLNVPAHPGKGEMWVTAFDIGQGMALLVETPEHRLLYDTGPAYSPESDAGSRVILPYLKARGITALDGVIVSHSDTDHSGGALAILDEIRVGWVSSSLPATHPVAVKATEHRRCEAGQAWEWDGARFDMLHPAAVSYESTKWKPNARSCTLKITLGDQSILLAGDIEAIQETELLEREGEHLASTVLLAPHHGSGTSSTMPFLTRVHPRIALFQVGYRNRYHHPKPEVFERYGELGITRVRTDEAGAITIRFGKELTESEFRKEHGRYWYLR
jgi:competence protein ComEC